MLLTKATIDSPWNTQNSPGIPTATPKLFGALRGMDMRLVCEDVEITLSDAIRVTLLLWGSTFAGSHKMGVLVFFPEARYPCWGDLKAKPTGHLNFEILVLDAYPNAAEKKGLLVVSRSNNGGVTEYGGTPVCICRGRHHVEALPTPCLHNPASSLKMPGETS